MTKAQKNELIENLATQFKDSNAIVVADYRGTTHKKLEALRVAANEAGAKVQVAKNTLVSIAIKNAGHEEIELTGTNIYIWSPDQITACKVADKFASDNKNTFAIKAGVIEGKAADAAMVNAFAKLPGREELLGMLASVWMGPVRNFTIGLDALRRKKEEEAA
ncbi:MAG: 50S ribosomal protein L10 [Campylobacterales bacterium]|nr:50S ribosomal protein L10 [Campylobacterales bacterium]